MWEGLEKIDLDEECCLWSGQIPEELQVDEAVFEEMWRLHPEEYHEIQMHGRLVQTPRWQQAYGMDYHYTGRTNQALPLPPLLQTYLDWCCAEIDEALNGVLLNWYDASLGHYIGKHRDSIRNMIVGTPIVTLSFGEERVFRMRPWKGQGYRDFVARHGRLLVIPWETNLAWTHEVPAAKKYRERRVSLTFRGFSA